MEKDKEIIEDFFGFIEASTTAYQTVLECERRLLAAGFTKLNMDESWRIQPSGRYYVVVYDAIMVAFTVAPEMHRLNGFRIIASHNDNPCFKIKSKPEMVFENCMKLNTEVYGDPILSTWLDRLLSIAGKVVLRSDEILKPRTAFVDLKKTVLTIPSIAIHMNKKVNEGIALNPQVDMIPVLGLLEDQCEAEGYLIKLIAKELQVDPSDILDFDLFVYLAEVGTFIGKDETLISAPRLDDLAMVYTSMEALSSTEHEHGINISVCFNHEEVGSASVEGADSSLLSIITERIIMGYNKTKEQYFRMIDQSFMISVDAAHAHHPNLSEKGDPTNRVLMNKGITIKNSARKSYGTQSESAGIFMQLCEEAKVPVQRFANKSDMIGGKTLGPIVSKYLPIQSVDVGMPMWAMHSAREVIGVQDFLDTLKVFKTFYKI